MALNALLKTKERHSHRLWILNWLEDNYECKQGTTICKAAVFSDYSEVCRVQKLKPVTNSLFGKLVKAVFPSIRTCRKGPRSDSRTHYAGLNRRRSTISLPQICPETGEPLVTPQMMAFIPASTGSDPISHISSDYSLTSSTPSSPSASFGELSPALSVEASGTLPAFSADGPYQPVGRYMSFAEHQQKSMSEPQPMIPFIFSSHPSLASCSSAGTSTYEDSLSEFEEMDLADTSASFFDPAIHNGCTCDSHDCAVPMPMAPACLCPSCDHESSSLEAVDDVLGDLEPRILNFDSSTLNQLQATRSGSVSFGDSGFMNAHVPHVQMSSSMMNPPVAPSPPASPPPPLSLMGSSDFSNASMVHAGPGGCKLRPAFLRRTMAMAAAKTTAHAADGNPLAEGLLGMINTCQKIIDRSQKRRRKSIDVKQEPNMYQQQSKKQYIMASNMVDANALVPPFVLNLDEIPGSNSNFALQESVLVFANEYRKMYQSVFDRLVRFEYAILFDFMFSFWSQVKLQHNFSALLELESVKKQILAYDKKVLQTFQDYFMLNPLKMSNQQFGGYLQTVAFHLPFAHERATSSLLPMDLREEKLCLFQSFAADLQVKAQSYSVMPSPCPVSAPAATIMEINNY